MEVLEAAAVKVGPRKDWWRRRRGGEGVIGTGCASARDDSIDAESQRNRRCQWRKSLVNDRTPSLDTTSREVCELTNSASREAQLRSGKAFEALPGVIRRAVALREAIAVPRESRFVTLSSARLLFLARTQRGTRTSLIFSLARERSLADERVTKQDSLGNCLARLPANSSCTPKVSMHTSGEHSIKGRKYATIS